MRYVSLLGTLDKCLVQTSLGISAGQVDSHHWSLMLSVTWDHTATCKQEPLDSGTGEGVGGDRGLYPNS